MREIKFRQAIKPQGQLPFRWHYWGYLHTNALDDFTPPLAKIDGDERPSYQFAEYHDKTDTEIYKDDIVQIGSSRFRVIFEDGSWLLRPPETPDTCDIDSDDFLFNWSEEMIEIIGNIQENSELMENN